MSYVDLRDIVEKKESEPREYKKWAKAFKDSYLDDIEKVADNEPLMIPENEFQDYAQELAEDTGAIGKDNQWPLYCIDWEYAARELKMDYSSVEVDGIDYYFRSY